MKSRTLTCITAMTLLALALPVQLAAQEPNEKNPPRHQYTFTEVPTLGGPNIYANQTGAKNNLINSGGTLTGGADTSVTDPYCPNSPDCFALHAFTFHDGALKDLGVLPGGFNSQAFWINARGTAAGFSEIDVIDPLIPNFPELRAVVWQNGKITSIGTFGGNDSMAQAINSRGQVVGFALNAIPDSMAPLPWPTQMRAFLWENGVMKNLGTLGGPDSWAFFVNDRGQVAGISYPDSTPSSGCDTPGKNHAFLWEKGHMQDVGTLGGSCSWPEDLSDQGQIVGWSNLLGDLMTHPFLWDNGTLNDLGTLGGSFGIATWINEPGEIIGGATNQGDQAFFGFVWKNGVMTELGPLPGDCFSVAKRNNSRGQIVGTSYSCDFASSRAVLWEHGSMIDLNSFVPPSSGLSLIGDVLYLDDRGEIAGNGVLPNGDIRFFTLIPVSEGDTPSESPAIQSNQSSTKATHGRLTPEMLAALRARMTGRYQRLGALTRPE